MNGLSAVRAPADVGRGDLAGNGIQQVDCGRIQMRHNLRRRRFRILLEIAARDQIRRNHKAKSLRADSRTVGDDEIAETQKRFVFFPDGNVQESVGADEEIDAVALLVVSVAEVAHGVHGVVELRAAEIFSGLRERRNKMRVLRAGQRSHGEAVRKGRQVLFELVRRAAGRNEMNLVKIEATVGGAGYGEMAVMNRIEGAAEERNAARMMFSGGAMRLRCGQCASRKESTIDFLTNS